MNMNGNLINHVTHDIPYYEDVKRHFRQRNLCWLEPGPKIFFYSTRCLFYSILFYALANFIGRENWVMLRTWALLLEIESVEQKGYGSFFSSVVNAPSMSTETVGGTVPAFEFILLRFFVVCARWIYLFPVNFCWGSMIGNIPPWDAS